ncbi:hypothetical protein XELAEV_18022949mg [Xenopus laevis]|uniref:Uncharacterized protein n=1 Tax=Xenopus laevis TaxID=8355 RepID=A0A974D5Z6_XENLA|nr:hypothetical protein XELAEV_18022949mg [Xenopus laevis]
MASTKKNRGQVSRNGTDLAGSKDGTRNSAAPINTAHRPHSASESASHRNIAASIKKLGRNARDQMEANAPQDSGDAASPLWKTP